MPETTCELCASLHEDWRVICVGELVFAVVNVEPLKEGHVMVLPKRHVHRLSDLDVDEAADFLQLADRLLQVVGVSSKEDALLVLNDGHHRSQPHLHAHILPSKGSLRDLFVSHEKVAHRFRLPRNALSFIADQIRQHLDALPPAPVN